MSIRRARARAPAAVAEAEATAWAMVPMVRAFMALATAGMAATAESMGRAITVAMVVASMAWATVAIGGATVDIVLVSIDAAWDTAAGSIANCLYRARMGRCSAHH